LQEEDLRIDSLEITNFKTIRHLKLDDIPDLILIAGPNGSGKTALFEAIRIFKESFGGYSIQSPGAHWIQALLTQVGPVITAGESEAAISATIKVSEIERELLTLPSDHSGALQGRVIIRQSTPSREAATIDQSQTDNQYLQVLFGSGYRSESGIGVIDHIGPDRRIGESLVSGINFSIERVESDYRRLVVASHEKFLETYQDIALMDYLDKSSHQTDVSQPKNYIEGVRSIFSHFLPTLEFMGVFPSAASGIKIQVRSRGTEHEIYGLSSGQREILMTYVHLEKLRPTGSIILFDEPELHLHPTLQRRVVPHLQSLLERGNNQIWVTTHSEEIVASSPFASLFAMTGEDGEAIQAIADQSNRVELLRQLGASVGVQLVSPRILFLEGQSDKDLLPLFIDELPVGVSLVETGGKRNLIASSEVTARLLEEIIREGRCYWVKDRDIEDDPGVLEQAEQRYSEYFFTWDRYHIENYLLDEDAIFRVLASEPGIPKPASVDAVRLDLKSIADAHRVDVLAKRLEAKLNPVLRTRLVLNPSEGVKESLLKAGRGRLERTVNALDQSELERILATEEAELDRCWNTDWKSLCVGRTVLQAYQQQTAPKFGYIVFRNAVARKLRESNRVPQPILKVMAAVTADLPRVQQG
jgi:predicted ATPase